MDIEVSDLKQDPEKFWEAINRVLDSCVLTDIREIERSITKKAQQFVAEGKLPPTAKVRTDRNYWGAVKNRQIIPNPQELLLFVHVVVDWTKNQDLLDFCREKKIDPPEFTDQQARGLFMLAYGMRIVSTSEVEKAHRRITEETKAVDKETLGEAKRFFQQRRTRSRQLSLENERRSTDQLPAPPPAMQRMLEEA